MKLNTIWLIVFWAYLFLSLGYSLIISANEAASSPSDNLIGLPIIEAIIVYCWFSADASVEGYRPSRWLKCGVLFLSFLAVPYYLLRVKGPKRTAKSLAKFALLFVATIVALGVAGLALGVSN